MGSTQCTEIDEILKGSEFNCHERKEPGLMIEESLSKLTELKPQKLDSDAKGWRLEDTRDNEKVLHCVGYGLLRDTYFQNNIPNGVTSLSSPVSTPDDIYTFLKHQFRKQQFHVNNCHYMAIIPTLIQYRRHSRSTRASSANSFEQFILLFYVSHLSKIYYMHPCHCYRRANANKIRFSDNLPNLLMSVNDHKWSESQFEYINIFAFPLKPAFRIINHKILRPLIKTIASPSITLTHNISDIISKSFGAKNSAYQGCMNNNANMVQFINKLREKCVAFIDNESLIAIDTRAHIIKLITDDFMWSICEQIQTVTNYGNIDKATRNAFDLTTLLDIIVKEDAHVITDIFQSLFDNFIRKISSVIKCTNIFATWDTYRKMDHELFRTKENWDILLREQNVIVRNKQYQMRLKHMLSEIQRSHTLCRQQESHLHKIYEICNCFDCIDVPALAIDCILILKHKYIKYFPNDSGSTDPSRRVIGEINSIFSYPTGMCLPIIESGSNYFLAPEPVNKTTSLEPTPLIPPHRFHNDYVHMHHMLDSIKHHFYATNSLHLRRDLTVAYIIIHFLLTVTQRILIRTAMFQVLILHQSINRNRSLHIVLPKHKKTLHQYCHHYIVLIAVLVHL